MPPSLDIRGDITAAQLAFYAPIAIITFFLTVRHTFEKDAGFFFLFFFSIKEDISRVRAEMKKDNLYGRSRESIADLD
ncbi:hypothetical protein C8J55DRAFT_553949 [Lentinula edodes]|uniref:DUF7702 domain-containing protein n=1 Tax=Lentinula lateritia TaxID=40482 RepID=A0A9W9E3Q5_9AGAR|nr:hypothetical protein C8J55DRAFT_553949 [Lentinula edodes]